jgi:hypothetical protein
VSKDKLDLSLDRTISMPQPATRTPFSFPAWPARLQADASLTPGWRESYRQTLTRFGEFCQQRKRTTSVAGAREFVELARLEHVPSPARLQEWKDALNWYFRRGREAAGAALKGVLTYLAGAGAGDGE